MPKTCWRLAEKNTSFLTFFWWLYITRHSFYTSHYVWFCFLFFKKVQYALGWLTHCYHSVPLTCDFKKQKMVDGEASKQFCENQIDNFWSFIYNVTLKSLHWSAHRLWNPQFQDLPSNTESSSCLYMLALHSPIDKRGRKLNSELHCWPPSSLSLLPLYPCHATCWTVHPFSWIDPQSEFLLLALVKRPLLHFGGWNDNILSIFLFHFLKCFKVIKSPPDCPAL